MEIIQNPDGTWSEKKEPYAVIECETEEDYNALKEALRRWIPVEERLPEDGEEVLVTVEGFNSEKYDKIPSFASSDVHVSGEWQNWNGVIAWMPLPKPYKPEN